MGERLIPQRRGRGSPRYKSLAHKAVGPASYPSKFGLEGVVGGQIIGFVKDPTKTAPLVEILLENQKIIRLIAPEGVGVGDWIDFGDKSKIKAGNILPLLDMPEGTQVFNIEVAAGDGGKLVRSGGLSASIVSHERNKGITFLRMPSKKVVPISNRCRATVGHISGGGRKEKPMVHAGQNYYRQKSRRKLYPLVGGTSMNAMDHPHGGGKHPHVGRPTTISRNTPPGRKVGHIAAKRTGRRK